MIERFNRTLKTMLQKHVSKFGVQWDIYLYGVLWVYRNVPHSSTGEKPSFLLYGFDCHHPTEAALLPPKALRPTDVSDYREKLILSLSSARVIANKTNTQAQSHQKAQYDKRAVSPNHKLSRPWHGPYRVVSRSDPDISAKKLFFPEDPAIQVHQSRVRKCPSAFPKDFYWYGGKRSKAGRPPKQILKQLEAIEAELKQPRVKTVHLFLMKQVHM